MPTFFHGTIAPYDSARFIPNQDTNVLVYPVKDPNVEQLIVLVGEEATVVDAGSQSVFWVTTGTTLTLSDAEGQPTRYVVVMDTNEFRHG